MPHDGRSIRTAKDLRDAAVGVTKPGRVSLGFTEFVRTVVTWRAAVPLLALPALACGCVLVATQWRPKLTVSVGSLLLLLPLGVVGYCFVRLIAPMYTYQPI